MATTKIYIVLDRSGSMESCREDTIGGFNSFVKGQCELKADKAFLSLFQFDNEYEIVYQDKKIDEVELLNQETFIPRGSTALLDAIGRTINSVLQKTDENIIVVIITDGHENASHEFTKSTINKMISEKKEKGWEFIFMGANQDAIKEASNLGIGGDSALTYSVDSSDQAFECLSGAISRSRSTPMKEAKKIAFTPAERSSAYKSKEPEACIDDEIDPRILTPAKGSSKRLKK